MRSFVRSLLLLLLLSPSVTYAGFFDFFRGDTPSARSSVAGTEVIYKTKSDCGTQIGIFKNFMRDGKICKQDDDCVTIEGMCPLGCKFYINKNFIGIITTEMEKVADKCENPVCVEECPKINVRPICKQNKCQARTK